MVGEVLPAWIAALQTLRREIEAEAVRDTAEGREPEKAIMIVREVEMAPGDGPDDIPAAVKDENRRCEPERFPFRIDHALGFNAPDGSNYSDLRFKTSADLAIDTAFRSRYIERGIFTSWDERPHGILSSPHARREKERANRLNALFERGATYLQAVPELTKLISDNFAWNPYDRGWLRVLCEVGRSGANSLLNTAGQYIWCRDNEGPFAEWCRENGKLFPVGMESRESSFRIARHEFRNLTAVLPQSLLVPDPTTYCVTVDDVLHQSVHLIDWLCEAGKRTPPNGSKKKRKAPPVSSEVADDLAQKIARSERSFKSASQREWAKRLKIAVGRVGKLPYWLELHPDAAATRRTRQPKVIALTKPLEESTGSADEELRKLIKEQETDDEGSPLDVTPRGKRSRRPKL